MFWRPAVVEHGPADVVWVFAKQRGAVRGSSEGTTICFENTLCDTTTQYVLSTKSYRKPGTVKFLLACFWQTGSALSHVANSSTATNSEAFLASLFWRGVVTAECGVPCTAVSVTPCWLCRKLNMSLNSTMCACSAIIVRLIAMLQIPCNIAQFDEKHGQCRRYSPLISTWLFCMQWRRGART